MTQLFRLPTGTSTTTTSFSSAVRSNLVEATSPPNVLLSSLGSLSTSYPVLADLLAPVLGAQQAQLAELGPTVSRYSHLAKPIGGTFIALALLFLLLGAFTARALRLPEFEPCGLVLTLLGPEQERTASSTSNTRSSASRASFRRPGRPMPSERFA